MIKICNDRSVFPNIIKISNQYENDTKIIDFDLEDVQFTGNTYLICKYQNEDEYYAPLLLDSNNSIPVKTFLSQRAGMYECLIIISNVKIDENYDFSNDNPLFVSNLFNIYISKNYLNGTAKQWELSSEMKNYYDRLIALVDKVQEDLNNGTFNGNGIKNIMKTGSVGLVDTYQILFTNSSTFDFQVTNGATPAITIQNGVWFVNGISTGVSAKGEKGNKGEQGKSAYQVAVDNGFEGTEEEWLESLKYYNSEEFAQLAEQIREDANTASSASQSAAQSKKSVDETVAQFNSDYTAKVNDFYKKVTDANTDLETKLGQANTAIDTKIQEATEQAQKATDEANRAEQATDGKLDKNLGVENAGKSLVVGENGEIVCGESGINEDEVNKIIDKAIDEKLYTQEEVDYMLADKMDKPYVPITITDNATITDALEGNFKIDKIKGNTYQNVEENILPTPDRPVPINSRKVLANDSYVELRSLKESKNLFDKNLLVANSNDTQKDSLTIQLKDKETYTISCSKNGIESILGVRATRKSDSADTEIMLLRGTTEQGSFTVDYATYENYIIRIYKNAYNIINTIQLELGSSATSYAPPIVRDYKIVDHANKTSKIIRNVGLYVDDKTGDSWAVYDLKGNYKYGYLLQIKDMKPSDRIASYVNTFRCEHNANLSHEYALWMGVNNNYLYFTKTDFTTLDEWKAWLASNDLSLLYPLATPVEEQITYLEDDVSEVGYSWQDTTSPSPTIPAEIKGVEEIDILKTGKNLLNEALLKNADDYDKTLNSQGFWEYILYLKPNTKYTISRENTIGYQLGYHIRVGTIRNNFNSSTWFVASHANNENKQAITITTNEDGIVVLYFNNTIELIKKCLETIGYLQLELGDTATAYEPYQGQRVNITLPQPMYQGDVANVESGEYEYEKQKYVVTGNEEFIQDYQAQSGYYGRFFNLGNAVQDGSGKCNCFTHTISIWNMASEGFCQNSNTQIHIKFSNDRLGITDNTPVEEKRLAFANYLKQLYESENPLYVVVKVTKTTQPISEEDLAKSKSLRTNAGINNIFINGEVKLSIEARYPQNVVLAVNRLQNKLLTLQEEVVKNV
jgi:hypothetical protein|nr:MAG TPA: tail sheath protein [Caudoviricetes sp.]